MATNDPNRTTPDENPEDVPPEPRPGPAGPPQDPETPAAAQPSPMARRISTAGMVIVALVIAVGVGLIALDFFDTLPDEAEEALQSWADERATGSPDIEIAHASRAEKVYYFSGEDEPDEGWCVTLEDPVETVLTVAQGEAPLETSNFMLVRSGDVWQIQPFSSTLARLNEGAWEDAGCDADRWES